MKDGLDKAKDKATPDNPVDKAGDRLKDYATDKAGDLAKNPTADGVKDVLSTVGNDATAAASRISRHAEQIGARSVEGNINVAERIVHRKVNGIVSHWRSLFSEVLHHPWRALKLEREAQMEAVKYTVGRAVEASPMRDWKAVAGLFNTGVDTRLESAEDDFKKAVSEAKRNYTVKHINVAVFGYDNGGALAIAFANTLMNDICSKGCYDGIQVKLKFIGLFDCVAHRYSDNLLLGYVPLSNAVIDELQIPKQAEKVVHLAAAHEFRFYKPLSIIKGKPELGAKYEEWLYPGSQADVGGGYEDGDDGKSSQLARVSLNFMHMQARRQAVPLLSLDALQAQSGKVYADFAVDASLKQLVDSYRKHAIELAKLVVPFTAEELTGQGTITETACIRGPSLLKPMMRLPETLKEELKGHQALFIVWFRSLYDANENSSDFGYNEFRRDMRTLELAVSGGYLKGEPKELYDLWKSATGQKPPADILPLFSNYVHNSIIEMDSGFIKTLARETDTLFYGPNQLHYRNILEIEKQPETNWLDDVKNTLTAAKKMLTEAQKASAAHGQKLTEIGPSGYPI